MTRLERAHARVELILIDRLRRLTELSPVKPLHEAFGVACNTRLRKIAEALDTAEEVTE